MIRTKQVDYSPRPDRIAIRIIVMPHTLGSWIDQEEANRAEALVKAAPEMLDILRDCSRLERLDTFSIGRIKTFLEELEFP